MLPAVDSNGFFNIKGMCYCVFDLMMFLAYVVLVLYSFKSNSITDKRLMYTHVLCACVYIVNHIRQHLMISHARLIGPPQCIICVHTCIYVHRYANKHIYQPPPPHTHTKLRSTPLHHTVHLSNISYTLISEQCLSTPLTMPPVVDKTCSELHLK